jgi:hypothetical protein
MAERIEGKMASVEKRYTPQLMRLLMRDSGFST